MSFTSAVTTLATAGTDGVELPGPTWAFYVTALAFFMMLLGVLWCFRNTAAKYDTPATVKTARPHGDAHGSPGTSGATDRGAHH